VEYPPEVNAIKKSLLYASSGLTNHDLRFIRTFTDEGWKVFFLRFDGLQLQSCSETLPKGAVEIDWIGTKEVISDNNYIEFLKNFDFLTQDIVPDLVVAGPIPVIGFLATQSSTAPVILISWAFDLLLDIHNSQKEFRQAQIAISEAHGIIVDCKTVASIVEELGGQREKIFSIPWGITLEDFPPGPTRISDGVFKIVSVRSLEKIYDVQTLIRAAAELRLLDPKFEFQITIVGTGSELPLLKNLADNLGVKDFVDWAPRIKEEELRSLILEHDLYVSTSSSDGSSISMLQALCVGQLVLVSNLESNLEWIEAGWNGWVFDLGNSRQLAEKILEVAKFEQKEDVRVNAPLLIHQRANWNVNKRELAQFLVNSVTR
jgi:glycosyltransferase involved in cell wall biosynthesis